MVARGEYAVVWERSRHTPGVRLVRKNITGSRKNESGLGGALNRIIRRNGGTFQGESRTAAARAISMGQNAFEAHDPKPRLERVRSCLLII